MAEDAWKPDIFEYLDYREFMADYYTAAKANIRAMSFRYLAQKAGFSSPNFYKLVMEKKRNLSVDSAAKVAKAMKLTGEQGDFFAALVVFEQADGHEQKNAAFARIKASQGFQKAGRIEGDLFEYLSCWYLPAIREMTARSDFQYDVTWISQQLFPSVSEKETSRALEVLLRLGLVSEDDGTLVRGEPALTTGHEVNSLGIVNYHLQMIGLGGDSIENVASDMRDISALTMCIRADQVADLKRRIHEFRESLIDAVDSPEDPDAVYQVNIQLFPINRMP